MRCTTVLVVKIIGVLPDVEGQQGLQAFGHGVASVGFLGNHQGTVSLSGEPYPTAAEETDALGFELGLEGVETPPLLLNLCLNLPRRLGRLGRELREVEVMVEHLTGIVEQRAGCLGHNLLQRQVFQPAAGQEFIQVVHVSLQVLAVVVRQGLGADDRLQR